jgi:hypothetical protein
MLQKRITSVPHSSVIPMTDKALTLVGILRMPYAYILSSRVTAVLMDAPSGPLTRVPDG